MNTDYDVVVVGGGNAALCAALSAHEAGARVLVLEAAPREERGGNSRFAGAVFRAPHSGLEDILPLLCEGAQEDAAKVRVAPYTTEDFRRDMLATTDGRADRDQMEVVIRDGYPTMEWLRDHGVHWELTLHKFFSRDAVKHIVDLPGGGAVKARHEGIGLTDDLWAAVEATSIDVRYDSPAHDLVTEGDTVLGVRVREPDGFVDFGGQVVLACGGFEANPALRRRYLGEGWDLVVVRGTRFNTGTMLEKAIDAGAQAYGHWGGCHSSPQDVNAPRVGDLSVTDEMSRYSYPYAIMVNVDGHRFMDEGEDIFAYTYAKTGNEIRRQPRATAFQIFDQKTLHLLEPRYRTATPVVDDTIEGLAVKLGIDPLALGRTVREFNAATTPAEINPFHKDGHGTAEGLTPPKTNWAIPIESPPYTAYAVTCGITFTYGGIKVDTDTRVLNNENRPMPGLYAAGEITGGFFYHNYPGGSGLTRGAVFGRLAGRRAAERAKARGAVSPADVALA